MKIDEIKVHLGNLGLGDNLYAAILLYLCGAVRRARRKMSVLVEGPSGFGKSYLVKEVLRLFPPEDKENISTITAAGIMRLRDVSTKILFMLEKYHDPRVALILREVLSEGEARRIMANGEATEELYLKGPTTLFETTTVAERFPMEDRNRSFVICINLSDSARENILALQRAERGWKGLSIQQEKGAISESHIKFQRSLDSTVKVVTPYAESIRPGRNTTLREQERLLNLIEAITFLEQQNREVKKLGSELIVEASEEDFHQAKEVLTNIQLPGDNLTLSAEALIFAKELLLHRDNSLGQERVTRGDLLRVFRDKYKTFKPIGKRLDELIEAGFVNIVKRGGYRNGYAYSFSDVFREMTLEDLSKNRYASFSLS